MIVRRVCGIASIACCMAISMSMSACERDTAHVSAAIDGNAGRGLTLLRQYECNVCHAIPGVRGVQGQVGPSLAQYRRNVYIAGKYPNTPEYLVAWLVDTPALAPQTAMPSLGLSTDEAQDVAAYLYSLR